MPPGETQRMIQRLRLERLAASSEVLSFWREHGYRWTQAEAGLRDIQTLACIGERTLNLSEQDAARLVASELKAIWNEGFQANDTFAWDEMNDQLPEAALLAFVQGVMQAWSEVRDKI